MEDDCGGCAVKKIVIGVLLPSIVLGALLNGWAVFASSEKDSAQDSRITSNEVQVKNLDVQLTRIQLDVKALIDISNKTLMAIKTHEAKGDK